MKDDFIRSIFQFFFLFILTVGLVSIIELDEDSYSKAYDPCTYDTYGLFNDSSCVPRSDYFIQRLDYVLSKHKRITYGALWLIEIQDSFDDSEPKISKFKQQLLLDRGIK